MEQREAGADLKALELINDYAKQFRYMDFTCHPPDLPGELAGKGSNVNWAARKLSERYPVSSRKDVIVTGIDGTYATPRGFASDASQGVSQKLIRKNMIR